MKATFDFTPKFCPNCGRKLFQPPEPVTAAGLELLRLALVDYHAGMSFNCPGCWLEFEKAPISSNR